MYKPENYVSAECVCCLSFLVLDQYSDVTTRGYIYS